MVFTELRENYYTFKLKTKEMIVEYMDDGSVEVYEFLSPTTTGFIFKDKAEFNFFCNAITDVIEKRDC